MSDTGWSSNGPRPKPLQPKTCERVCASIVRSLTGCYLCKGRDTIGVERSRSTPQMASWHQDCCTVDEELGRCLPKNTSAELEARNSANMSTSRKARRRAAGTAREPRKWLLGPY